MIQKLLFIAAFTLLAHTLSAQKTLPNVSLKNIDGESIEINEYSENGKITILSFWATWCSPCKKELNNISDLYEDWQADYDVELVAISMDDQRNSSKIKPTVNGQGWEFTVLLDVNEDLKRALNFQSIPYTIVIDKSGEIVYEHTGYVEGDEYELEDVLKELSEK